MLKSFKTKIKPIVEKKARKLWMYKERFEAENADILEAKNLLSSIKHKTMFAK